ncbi:hypothetical protein DN752_22920 [Echinicola strongylocentroti]|uniref:DUF4959 domain-containing protein n=1 Tax=Echinicola strongylocentroti TaxID=1795355 RepID=A0A2Z4IR36_9BACT|nr:DUF5000 domain-containing lipoprotein [Echinicola strongylocentroti]AWW32763.1 hypothetical protein DN752_22920 [Echinicola strongylocentroti]
MNINIKILAIFSLLACFSCEEEYIEPYPEDGVPPGKIGEVVVSNLPGGAKIEYATPQDEDALLVEAHYTRDDGKEVVTKSSIYKNFITVEGLREIKERQVSLIVVDRSNNKSEPVNVSINPEKAPIDQFYETMELVEDFGGVRLRFDNSNNLSAEILLYSEDDSGNLVYTQSTFVNNDQQNSIAFRGFDVRLQKFAVKVIDRWNNITDTYEEEITPLKESFIPIENFRDIFLTGDQEDAFGWVKTNMWNNTLGGNGFHTAQDEPGHVVAPYTESYHMFTMDLGTTVKLSRFKFWQRQGGWIFRHGNPRLFDLWGIDELPEDSNGSLEGWVKLVDNGEDFKPSGGPEGSNSAEDQAAAAAGEEFDCNVEAPPVRYIRFVNKESWSGGKFMHIMEINFWGQEVEQ